MVKKILNVISSSNSLKDSVQSIVYLLDQTTINLSCVDSASPLYFCFSDPVYIEEELSLYDININLPSAGLLFSYSSKVGKVDEEGIFKQLDLAYENVFYEDFRDYLLLALFNYLLLSSGYFAKDENIERSILVRNILHLDGFSEDEAKKETKRIILEFK